MEHEVITIEYNGKKVEYNTYTQAWTYDGEKEIAVLKLNPELAKQITKALEKSVVEYKERIKSEEKKRQAEEKKKRMVELEAFKAQVTPLIPNGFTTDFSRADDYGGDVRRLKLKKGTADADIDYSDRVYHSGSYHASRTDMPWKVEFNYKSQRFTTLEKAIANAVKKVGEKFTSEERQREHKEQLSVERHATAEKLKELGISFGFDSEWVRTGNRSGGYTSEHEYAKITLSKGIAIKGRVDRHEGNPIVIYNATIQGKLSPEQFKKLADFIKELKPSKDEE